MRRWPIPVLASLLTLPALFAPPAGGQALPSPGFDAGEAPAQPGTRTVCIGQQRDGVRVVGCFDVHRLEIGPIHDPTKGTDLRQYVWKYTAEADGGEKYRLARLQAEVNSDAGTTYGWDPGASIPLSEATTLRASAQTDIVFEQVDGGPPKLVDASDGWTYRALTGEIHPRLTDNRFATLWLAPKGKTAPRGEVAQVGGATVWGAPVPGPELLPARLRVEVTYR